MHVESSLPALRSKAGRVHPPPEGYKRKKKLREVDPDKQKPKQRALCELKHNFSFCAAASANPRQVHNFRNNSSSAGM